MNLFISLSVFLPCLLQVQIHEIFIYFPKTNFLSTKWLLTYFIAIGYRIGHFRGPFISGNVPNIEEEVGDSGQGLILHLLSEYVSLDRLPKLSSP